ncbi:MAG: hypothetical protein PHY29_03130 [Syntrophales bacterium]|nr:hypothetical protein [Syntrophales bacterium]
MTNNSKPSEQEIREFVAKHKSLGHSVAEILTKIAPEVKEIMETGVGWELLRGDVEKAGSLAIHVLKNENVTDVERFECKYLLFDRLPRIARKITEWYKAIGLIRSQSGKGTS